MARVNVYLPDELAATLRAELPELNLSQLVQEAIRGVLGCSHVELACRACAEPIDRWALVDDHLGRFYGDLLWELTDLVGRCGTAEGAARVVKAVAQRFRIRQADQIPLPRPTRAERHAAKVRELPTEAESRRRHPTAHPSPNTTAPAMPPAQEDIA